MLRARVCHKDMKKQHGLIQPHFQAKKKAAPGFAWGSPFRASVCLDFELCGFVFGRIKALAARMGKVKVDAGILLETGILSFIESLPELWYCVLPSG